MSIKGLFLNLCIIALIEEYSIQTALFAMSSYTLFPYCGLLNRLKYGFLCYNYLVKDHL